MTKYFLDTEFIENGVTIDLVSIGLVCEDGREYYAQSLDANHSAAGDWVARCVLPHLTHYDLGYRRRNCSGTEGQALSGRLTAHSEMCTRAGGFDNDCPWRRKRSIAEDLKLFCDPTVHGQPEFWAYYGDYDWVALCQLFGTMMDLPQGWPKYCRDLKQWCDELGNPRLPTQGEGEHHALADARWNRQVWDFLNSLPRG